MWIIIFRNYPNVLQARSESLALTTTPASHQNFLPVEFGQRYGKSGFGLLVLASLLGIRRWRSLPFS
jgi:hypothetical protein